MSNKCKVCKMRKKKWVNEMSLWKSVYKVLQVNDMLCLKYVYFGF